MFFFSFLGLYIHHHYSHSGPSGVLKALKPPRLIELWVFVSPFSPLARGSQPTSYSIPRLPLTNLSLITCDPKPSLMLPWRRLLMLQWA